MWKTHFIFIDNLLFSSLKNTHFRSCLMSDKMTKYCYDRSDTIYLGIWVTGMTLVLTAGAQYNSVVINRVFEAHYFYCLIFLAFSLSSQKSERSLTESLLPVSLQDIHFFNGKNLVPSVIIWKFDFPRDSPCSCPGIRFVFL